MAVCGPNALLVSKIRTDADLLLPITLHFEYSQ